MKGHQECLAAADENSTIHLTLYVVHENGLFSNEVDSKKKIPYHIFTLKNKRRESI